MAKKKSKRMSSVSGARKKSAVKSPRGGRTPKAGVAKRKTVGRSGTKVVPRGRKTIGQSSLFQAAKGIQEYRIVHFERIRELEDEVNYLISKGWEPIGGLMEDEATFFQPMVRRAEG